MNKLNSIKTALEGAKIYLSNDAILDKPSVVGYEKKFRWGWMATQLNTFVVASDYGSEQVTKETIEKHLTEAFAYAKKHYKGWPRGFQSGLGVISIIISTNLSDEAIEYCHKLSSGKKWAGFTIPVVINGSTGEVHSFDKKPMWGAIYYPHFRKMIDEMTK
jgi:hypothetical protein